MSLTLAALILIIVIPLILHLRGAHPGWMFAAVSCLLLVLGVGAMALLKIAPQLFQTIMLSQAGTDRAYHDTYYVVSNAQWVAALAIIPVIFALLLWLQSRLRALSHPRLTRWLFWPSMAIVYSALGTAFYSQYGMPRRYIDYETYFERVYLIQIIAALICLVAFAALVSLFVVGLLRRSRP